MRRIRGARIGGRRHRSRSRSLDSFQPRTTNPEQRTKNPTPIIALLSDFGTGDSYVASLKGAILSIAPGARLVDISHEVPPGSVRSGAYLLWSCYRTFPAGTMFVAVVDPGVGTDRPAVAVAYGGFTFVGPDNGLFGFLPPGEKIGGETPVVARRIANPGFLASEIAPTFHGRDVFAPAAAHLAAGAALEEVGPAHPALCGPAWPEPLRQAEADGDGWIEGEVIHLDRFGNAISNIDQPTCLRGQKKPPRCARTGGREILFVRTFADVSPGEALAYFGSSGMVEIAVNQGDAATEFGLTPGAALSVHP